MSVVDSMAMVVPVFVALANLWLTMRGVAGRVYRSPTGQWVLIGTIWYLITCVQGPLQSLPTLQRVTHFNNWTVGHAHIAVLGFSGFIALGTLWHILPLITKRRLYSNKLVWLQLGLVTVGITGFFVVLTIAGLLQGQAWYNGEVVYRVLPELPPYMALRLSFGLFIITGAIVGLYNMFMSICCGERFEPKETVEPSEPKPSHKLRHEAYP
jgi:cytochrome c oxidase cbb3-type subunit 1/cytochrome c oxidase cbb3-type subunit I/II